MLFGELINKGKLYSSTSVVFAVTLAASLGVLFAATCEGRCYV